jgi:hypothetical protein
MPGMVGVGDTPLETRGLQQLRQKIEQELGKETSTLEGSQNVSPGLVRLRNTPGIGLFVFLLYGFCRRT